MPMEVVQAVLLVSADPMGERISNPDSPDSTYGWGVVNLGRAISMQGTVRIARPTLASPSSSALSPEKSRMKLAPAFVHLQESLQDVQLAVGGVRGAYYNMQMADLVDVQAAPEQPVRPDSAARDMLAEHRDHRLARHEVRLGPGRRARFSVDRQGGQLRGFGIDFSAGPAGAWRIEQRGCADCIGTWAREAEVFDLANSGPGAPFFAGRGTSFGVEMRTGSLRPFFAVSGGSSGQSPGARPGCSGKGAATV